VTHRSIGRGSALIRRAGLAPIARVGLVLGLAAGLALPWFTPAGLAQTTWRYYFPMILGPGLPAGTYDCEEYEAGLIWTTDVITLFPDGDHAVPRRREPLRLSATVRRRGDRHLGVHARDERDRIHVVSLGDRNGRVSRPDLVAAHAHGSGHRHRARVSSALSLSSGWVIGPGITATR